LAIVPKQDVVEHVAPPSSTLQGIDAFIATNDALSDEAIANVPSRRLI